MAVRWLYIRMVVIWGASLGGLDSIRFGSGPILRLWFNSTDRLIELFVVFAGWLSELSSSGSSNGCLVLVTVVWFWRRSSGDGDGRLVLVTAVWFWRRSPSSSDGRLVLVTVVWF